MYIFLRGTLGDTFGLNTPSQLIIGYHRVAFVNQVLSLNILEIVSTNSNIIKKNENRKTGNLLFHKFQNTAHLFRPKTQSSHFLGGGGVCMSLLEHLIGTGPDRKMENKI